MKVPISMELLAPWMDFPCFPMTLLRLAPNELFYLRKIRLHFFGHPSSVDRGLVKLFTLVKVMSTYLAL